MKAFFKELFQYNHHYNQALVTVLIENPKNASEKSIKLLSHMLNSHKIWNNRIEPGPPSYARWEVHQIQDALEIDKQNFEHSMRILDTLDLSLPIQYATEKGQVFIHSLHEILFQVINHSTYHRGQIATEFRQSGLEPLLTDYIFYKMK
ncbi:MAG TPA: DinB family protein [Chryseolinea sp.]